MTDKPSDWAIGIVTTLAIIGIAVIVGVTILLESNVPAQPEQEVSQYVDKRGDVKRLCLVFKTGDHVDAISCNVIDDMTGDLK